MLLSKEEKDKHAEEDYALVFYIVNMFRNSGVSTDELESIAVLGFAKALNAYSKDRNVKFSTYAINCMRNEVLFFLRKENQHMAKNTSLNAVLSTDKNGNDLELADIVSYSVNDGTLGTEDNYLLENDLECLEKALAYLTEKERYILIYRYGLFNANIKTQKDIAEDINMSQANVSKIEKSSLEKLNKILRNKYHVTYTGVRD